MFPLWRRTSHYYITTRLVIIKRAPRLRDGTQASALVEDRQELLLLRDKRQTKEMETKILEVALHALH